MVDIVLVGEAWGENEAHLGQAFVGTSGVEILRQLNEAEILTLTGEDQSLISRFYREGKADYIDMIWRMHPEIYRTNVINARPAGNDILAFCGPKELGIRGFPALQKGKYLRAEFIPELERLSTELVEADPNIIICLGNTALWALSARVGISKLRGTTFLTTHTATGFKAIATYHPAAVQRQWAVRPTVILDLIKAKRESGHPQILRLQREIWIEPTLGDLEAFYERYIKGTSILSVDIETSGKRVTCIGFAPGRDRAIVIPFDDKRRKGGAYWQPLSAEISAWEFVKGILEDPSVPKLFQNGLYDISFLWAAYGIGVRGAQEDTMLLHHALQPESLKSLGFLGSIYVDEGAWKQMRGKEIGTIKGDDE